MHVEDLAGLFVKAAEASQAPLKIDDDPETWSKKGYYFVTTGEHQWDDVAAWISEEAHR